MFPLKMISTICVFGSSIIATISMIIFFVSSSSTKALAAKMNMKYKDFKELPLVIQEKIKKAGVELADDIRNWIESVRTHQKENGLTQCFCNNEVSPEDISWCEKCDHNRFCTNHCDSLALNHMINYPNSKLLQDTPRPELEPRDKA